MSINKVISVKNAIIDAQVQLGIDHDKDIPAFTLWATRAEKEIGSYFQYERKRTVIDIHGCSACLPVDAVLVEVAVMGDKGEDCGNLLTAYCGNSSVTTTNFVGQANFLIIDVGGVVGETITLGYVGFEIQNNKIILNSPRDGQKMTVQYLRYKTDCDGFMEVGENHILAIKAYICMNWHLRSFNKSYIDRDMINFWKQEWDRECRHARAEDNRLTPSDHQEAARIYSNPISGRGIWQGMYTTLGNSFSIWG